MTIPIAAQGSDYDEISVFYNGALVQRIDDTRLLTPGLTLDDGAWHRVNGSVDFAGGTVSLEVDGNSIFSKTPVPGLAPFESRIVFGARTGSGAEEAAIDNLNVQFGCINRIVNNDDSGEGSLRAVIANACAGSTITFAPNVRGAINLTGGELSINKSLTISGPGANLLSVQRSTADDTPDFRIFSINGGAYVTLSGLTIANGISDSGGGIYNRGSLTITHSTISGNRATGDGGGIYNEEGLTISNSTLSGNTAFFGGGIYNEGSFGRVNVTHSTISGNSASRDGGGIYNFDDTVNVTNSTIFANSAGRDGGGIANFLGNTLTARNTIVAGNTAMNVYPDVNGSLTSWGFNLIGNDSGATIAPAQISDQIGTAGSPLAPLLGPLQDNGGPTRTHALLSGSRAIDKGHSSGSSTDQRGFTRQVDNPVISNASGGDGSDIGAFEFGGVAASLEILSFTRLGDGSVVLQVAGIPNGVHTIQASVDLSFGSFLDIATVTADAAGLFQYQDTRAGSARNFYRVAFP